MVSAHKVDVCVLHDNNIGGQGQEGVGFGGKSEVHWYSGSGIKKE